MKVILEYDDDDGVDAVRLALYAGKMAAAIQAFDESLRKMEKYEGDEPVAPSDVRRWLRDETEDIDPSVLWG